jgi:outer membrane biosynthesis protein TonB
MIVARLLFFICVSLVFHVFAVDSIPGFEFEFKPRKRTIEVELLPPAVRELPPAPKQKPGSSVVNKNSEVNEAPQPALAVPDIDIPDFSGVEDLDVKVPELNVSKLDNNSRLKADEELLKELKSSSDNFQKANQPGEGIESDVTGSNSNAKDFFVIKNLNRNRKLAHIPEKPSFALTADTTVNVSFKIDREGNPYSIILKSRTDSNIERLAIDFVKKLQFNAVLAGEPEQAEIILYFRVR